MIAAGKKMEYPMKLWPFPVGDPGGPELDRDPDDRDRDPPQDRYDAFPTFVIERCRWSGPSTSPGTGLSAAASSPRRSQAGPTGHRVPKCRRPGTVLTSPPPTAKLNADNYLATPCAHTGASPLSG